MDWVGSSLQGPKLGHKIWVQFGIDGIEPSGSKFGSNKFRLVLSVNHFKFELDPQVMLNLNGSKFGFLDMQTDYFDCIEIGA